MTRSFDIGLTMAGAISAGAYTAGVMDFFFEALDSYYKARSRPDWDGPTHDVRIPIMSGASAGGMTSAICALHAFHERFDHIWPQDAGRRLPDRRRNRLYASWVDDIDMRRLLETSDIDAAPPNASVRSLLCCDVIDQIVHDAFDIEGGLVAREWIGCGDKRTLRLRLTLTNLRGVPYAFDIYGAGDPRRYGMLNHGDYLDFEIGFEPSPEDGVHALDINDTTTDAWELFRTAAKATGAFPVGLAPRRLSRAPKEYYYASRVGYDTPDGFRVIAPDKWIDAVDPYDFVSVDGGAIDNEPLEMTRRFLLRAGETRNPHDGLQTDRAVILIAPFPTYLEATKDIDGELSLIQAPGALLSTLIDQARFKPDELTRAADQSYYSRYLIAPARDDIGAPLQQKYPIACGVMNGFGGFLHRSFRRHDYLLGRRNAQAFLRWHFALPEDADLFAEFTGDREKWIVREPGDAATSKSFAMKEGASRRGLPIIPLTQKVAKEIVVPRDDFPDPDALFRPDRHDELTRLVEARADKVVAQLVDVDLALGGGVLAPFERWGAKRVGAAFAVRKAMGMMDQAIDDVRKAFFPLR